MDALAEPQSIFEEVYGDDGDGVEIIELVKEKRSEYDYESRVTLLEGVKNLPEKEKIVIEMRYYQGATQTEIAKELAISQAQVSRLDKGAIEKVGKGLYMDSLEYPDMPHILNMQVQKLYIPT